MPPPPAVPVALPVAAFKRCASAAVGRARPRRGAEGLPLALAVPVHICQWQLQIEPAGGEPPLEQITVLVVLLVVCSTTEINLKVQVES